MSRLVKLRPKAAIVVYIGALVIAIIVGPQYNRQLSQAETQTPTHSASEGANLSSPQTFAGKMRSNPDALIVTKSLSELPKDILRHPLLKTVLTENFLFYYEENEGFLGLKGTIRRIAYEHKLNMFEELLVYILHAPAELAYWKSPNGRLDQYMLVINRTGLTDLLRIVTKVIANDSQLSLHSERLIPSQGNVSIYKLHFAHNEDLYFTVVGEKLIFFTSPEMSFPTAEEQKKWADSTQTKMGKSKTTGTYSKLFELVTGKSKTIGTFSNLFEAEEEEAKHRIYLTASYLSLGYQKFFPSIEAIKFRYRDTGWDSLVLTTPARTKTSLDSASLWAATPKSPALCAALPIEAEAVAKLLEHLYRGKENEIASLIRTFRSPVGMCWYPESKLYTPLILVRLEGGVNKTFLMELFDKSIGSLEAGILSAEEKETTRAQQMKRASGEMVENPIKTTIFTPPFAVTETIKKQGTIWSREVSSRYGIYSGDKSTNSVNMRSKKYFVVRLAQWKNMLVFSPDDRLVDNVIAVLNKKYPAVSDQLPSRQSRASLIVHPQKTAELIKQSIIESLPPDQESIFRESVSRRLFPALDKLKAFPAYSMNMPSSLPPAHAEWKELKWQAISN